MLSAEKNKKCKNYDYNYEKTFSVFKLGPILTMFIKKSAHYFCWGSKFKKILMAKIFFIQCDQILTILFKKKVSTRKLKTIQSKKYDEGKLLPFPMMLVVPIASSLLESL